MLLFMYGSLTLLSQLAHGVHKMQMLVILSPLDEERERGPPPKRHWAIVTLMLLQSLLLGHVFLLCGL